MKDKLADSPHELEALRQRATADARKIAGLQARMAVTRSINQELLRANNETDLFRRVCRILTSLGDYRFAWIGLVQKGASTIKPVAQAGSEKDYLASIEVKGDNSAPAGPTGAAIDTGRPFIIRDVENDPTYEGWRKETLKRGCASSIALPLVHQDEIIGALSVYSPDKDAFNDEEAAFLMEVAGDIAVGVKTMRLEKMLGESVVHLRDRLDETVKAVAMMGQLRDPYTFDHQQRVALLASDIAREMGLPEEQTEGVRAAGLLHDIGKASIPTEILSRPGRLSPQEWELMKTHPQVGYDILKGIDFPWPVAPAVLQHHERLDGSGYPGGLSGSATTLEAKILAVADVVEAMSSHRPYRPALGVDWALGEISAGKGVLYDPTVADACLRLGSRLFAGKEITR